MGKAVISSCGRYRYVLRRVLTNIADMDPNATESTATYKPVTFIMLNPSTADAVNDDPTIRRCIAFAKREGGSHLNVVNLFAYRTPSPAELKQAKDPIGPENDHYIREEVAGSAIVVAAWGAEPFAAERAREVYEDIGRIREFMCLGKTKAGAPRHPLYVSNATPLVAWRASDVTAKGDK
jgi:hypothetical protein